MYDFNKWLHDPKILKLKLSINFFLNSISVVFLCKTCKNVSVSTGKYYYNKSDEIFLTFENCFSRALYHLNNSEKIGLDNSELMATKLFLCQMLDENLLNNEESKVYMLKDTTNTYYEDTKSRIDKEKFAFEASELIIKTNFQNKRKIKRKNKTRGKNVKSKNPQENKYFTDFNWGTPQMKSAKPKKTNNNNSKENLRFPNESDNSRDSCDSRESHNSNNDLLKLNENPFDINIDHIKGKNIKFTSLPTINYDYDQFIYDKNKKIIREIFPVKLSEEDEKYEVELLDWALDCYYAGHNYETLEELYKSSKYPDSLFL
jgi:hypothetical protein